MTAQAQLAIYKNIVTQDDAPRLQAFLNAFYQTNFKELGYLGYLHLVAIPQNKARFGYIATLNDDTWFASFGGPALEPAIICNDCARVFKGTESEHYTCERCLIESQEAYESTIKDEYRRAIGQQ